MNHTQISTIAAQTLRRGSRQSVTLCFIIGIMILLTGIGSGCQAQTPQPASVVSLDHPFLFTYGTWHKKARIDNGVVFLDADGMTPKGGAGINQNLDLSAHKDDCPAASIKLGAHSTLKTLRLMLQDTNGHTGTWNFALSAAPSAGFVVLTPIDGASFSQPGDVGKNGPPDLAKIMQWQIMGDWGDDGPIDAQVNAILAVAPTDAIKRLRQARLDKDAFDHEQARKDREAQRAKYGTPTALSPVIEAVYAAAPNVLALSIKSGTITPTHLTPYAPQRGDSTMTKGTETHLVRGGQDRGYLIGLHHDALMTYEGFSGDPLLVAEADDPANYTIKSADDPAFAGGKTPMSVARKSKAEDWQQPKQTGLVVRHIVYLHLTRALIPGKTYTVSLGAVNTRTNSVTLVFDPARVRSESIHVDQVGFRPDDPLKRAYLSLWMGTGGGYAFAPNLPFHLVDAATEKTVYAGHVATAWPAEKLEKMATVRNFNNADVAPIDFSEFKTPGRYRIVVDGIGCSYSFEIGRDVWTKAFFVQMKGFYNQRSGMALGPPYTKFVRPRDFHPGDADVSVTQSTYSVLDGGDPQKDLAKGDTGKPVRGAWGGYHDAGDWNPRRITHLQTSTFWQLELMELFPRYFQTVALNIPKSSPAPDLVNECRFAVGLFRRLQRADGGVPFGIETNGDPSDGEVSWKQSMPAYVYAPDVESSYLYAAIMARLAGVVAPYDALEAESNRESALKAMAWAEADRARRIAGDTWTKLGTDAPDDRGLAAIELYALTREKCWHDVYLEDTPLKDPNPKPFYGALARRDSVFRYARLPQGLGDQLLKKKAITAIIADADGTLAYEQNNAFGIASGDLGKPQFLGFYSTPHGAVSLARAYYLTKNLKYLAGSVQACLFPGGANPNNIVYTTGVGANPIKHPLNLDSRWTGQPAPVGITTYGNVDLARWGDQNWIIWPLTYYMNTVTQPMATEWPTSEAYFDVFFMTAEDELTVDQTMGPNAYVWGFLAARK